MRYLLIAICCLSLFSGAAGVAYAQTSTDTPTPTETPTPSATPTETVTPAPTLDLVTVYDLGNGKSGELIYTATAGEIAIIALGVSMLILMLVLVMELKRK